MTTIADIHQAGVDAVIADNTLNQNGFEDAIQAAIPGINNAEADDWVTALVAEWNRVGITNNPTWANYRAEIIGDGAPLSFEKFEALIATVMLLPSTGPIDDAVQLFDLRDTRDNIDAALDECDVLIAAQPAGSVGRLVKDAIRVGKDWLRFEKTRVRSEIQAITGDPDSL